MIRIEESLRAKVVELIDSITLKLVKMNYKKSAQAYRHLYTSLCSPVTEIITSRDKLKPSPISKRRQGSKPIQCCIRNAIFNNKQPCQHRRVAGSVSRIHWSRGDMHGLATCPHSKLGMLRILGYLY